MDHQPDIRLVDAHAEGIGRRDRAQVAADETPLHVLLGLRRQAGVKMFGLDVLQLQIFGNLLASPPRRAIDDGAPGRVRRQVRRQYLMDMCKLLAAGSRDHLEAEVRPFGAAVEDRQLDAELVPEMPRNVLDHVGLGGRGQAQHRRRETVARLLADKPADIEIVGPEVVTPARQAMRFVQHPGADFALIERAPQGAGAKLLRRDDEDASIAEPDPVQRIGPLGHREQSVDRDAGANAAGLQSVDLILHQRDQRRNHHSQRAGLVVPRQGRKLIAKRLAGPGGQDSQNTLAPHRRFDDGLLHGASVVGFRFGAKSLQSEPALQFGVGIVPFPAPAARGIGAGRVPESAHQLPGLRELVAHPGRHHRIAAGDRQPGQRIGRRPAGLRLRHNCARVGYAGHAFQLLADRCARLFCRRAPRTADFAEQRIESAVGACRVRRAQPMPRDQQVRRRQHQGFAFVVEQVQRKT